MKLRDHPLMSYKGLCSWPPVWIHPTDSLNPITVKGEVGILMAVRMHDLRSRRIFLHIKYDGALYLGCLFLDDSAFHQQMFHFLVNCIGMSIKEIGNEDLSQTF